MQKLFYYTLVLFSCICFSQNKQLLYGFTEIPQSLLSNPGAKVNNKGYFGIPLLSHIHVNVGSSGVSAFDLFADNGVNFNVKLRNVVDNLRSVDFFTATQQLEVFSGGIQLGPAYNKNQYLSFGFYQETDFISYFPKDFAILALEGNQPNIGRPFEFDQVSFDAELLSVLHVGYNKRVNEKLTYGIRGKIYSSVANINSTRNEGRFITTQSDVNTLQQVFDLDLEVRTSGIAGFIEDDDDDEGDSDTEGFGDVGSRFLFGGNLGLGVDLGFTYQKNEQWYFDASILDFGFITYTKDVENYEIEGNFVFEGIDPFFIGETNPQTANEVWTAISEDFEALFDPDTTQTKYTKLRPVKLNTSLNYAFGKKMLKECNCVAEEGDYLNRVGGQLYAIARPRGPQLALSAYYYRRIAKGLSAKATYTIDPFSSTNVGLGVSAQLGGFNMYLLTDNLLAYRNIYDAQSVSLQLGFNYIFRNEN